MAEVQEKLHDVQEKVSGASGNTALKAAAAAAATTAATYAVRRAMSHDDDDRSRDDGSSNGSKAKSRGGSSGILASAAATSWEAAADVLLPLADDAAEAAGKYIATHGPEILRERIIPKFIEAFNEAK